MEMIDLLMTLKQFPLWCLNGLLVTAYILWQVKWIALLGLVSVVLILMLPRWIGDYEARIMKVWIDGSLLLLLVSSAFVSGTFALLSFLIILFSILAIIMDRFHPAQTAWKLVYGALGYALIGIGYLLLTRYLGNDPTLDGFQLQGQNYLGVMAGILLYLYPVGYIALLFKDLTLHKTQMDPVAMMDIIRKGGRRNE